MAARRITVVKPGSLTTVQDLGRHGFAHLGIAPCGAMDGMALCAANRLVGNDEAAAGLEITLLGPTLSFSSDAVIALTGSTFEADVDGEPIAPFASRRIVAGSSLRIGASREGARCWLAVGGGIDVPMVLGSRSTHLSAAFGGFAGRALRAGDVIAIGPAAAGPLRRMAALEPYATSQTLRFIAGPQAEAFSAEAQRRFRSEWFAVSARSDRTGVRLETVPLAHRAAADLLPEGLVAGSVQVPADGHPIVLGVDRPATGGYVKIATVISADLGRLASAKPGDRLRFEQTTVEAARRLARQRDRRLSAAIAEHRE
jgi:antagonist of KipI